MQNPRQRSAYNRRRYLPVQLDATRRKLVMLVAEAKRNGMHDILLPEERQ